MSTQGSNPQGEREGNSFLKENFSNLFRFYETSFLTDATIRLLEVGTEKVLKEYKVHSLVLAMSSPVFEASFSTPFKTEVIEMNDTSAEAMDLFINFMYTGEIELESVHLTWSLYHLADKYLLTKLREICSLYIISNTGKGNICTGFEMSKIFNGTVIHEELKKILFENFSSVIDNEDFLSLQPDSLLMILEETDLKVRECELYKAVNDWVTNYLAENKNESVDDGDEQNSDNDNNNKKPKLERPEMVQKILSLIFFMDMTPQEFAEVSNLGLITMEESHAILVNLSTKNAPLPWPKGFRKCSRKLKNFFDPENPHSIDLDGHVDAQTKLTSVFQFTVSDAISISAIEISCVEMPPDLSLNYYEKVTLWCATYSGMVVSNYSGIVNYGSSIKMTFEEPVGLTDDDIVQMGIEFAQTGIRRSKIIDGTLSCDDITFTFLPSDEPLPFPVLSIELNKLL